MVHSQRGRFINWCKYVFLIQIVFYLMLYFQFRITNNSEFPKSLASLAIEERTKELLKSQKLESKNSDNKFNATILYWTNWFNSRDIKNLIKENTFSECEVKCEVTFNKDLLQQSDSLLFHASDLRKNDLPPRFDHHAWIFMYMESPRYTKNLHPFTNMEFNLTMSYRLDSDIYHPYGRLIPRNKETDPYKFTTVDLKQNLKNRKLAAWLVSNCKTRGNREKYIKELSTFIPVDIYGRCGPFKCKEKDSANFNCISFLGSSYKFYLSFENSLCHDYVTEKFFLPMNENIVPVVYGGANYSLHAPNGSYINTNDFNSPKELSEYLLYLDSHDEEYLKYFEWKREFKSVLYPNDSEGPWCLLCKKVVALKEMLKNKNKDSKFSIKTYNIEQWWNQKPNSSLKACN